jgi:glycine/D-amino acid oxidase-like deaminating enzyme
VAGRLTISGIGYKFAPWVGRVLAQLAVQRGTVYDIGRFTPAPFAGGAPVTGVAS